MQQIELECEVVWVLTYYLRYSYFIIDFGQENVGHRIHQSAEYIYTLMQLLLCILKGNY